MNYLNPVGVFDSGIGGLSIARSIRNQLPNENLLYVADSYNAPYGAKSNEFIYQRSSIIIKFLLERKAKAIVIACNTATVSVIQKLRDVFPIPVIGVEPGIKPATLLSKNGSIGVLVTEQTLKSNSFQYLKNRFSNKVKITVQACPGLVEQIENANLDGHETLEMIQYYVHPLLEKGVDTIVLGCTHYTFLIPQIKKIVGSSIEIINTSMAVAHQVVRKLDEKGLLSSIDHTGFNQFWTNSKKTNPNLLFSRLWGETIEVKQMCV